jgi:hypothetical protein
MIERTGSVVWVQGFQNGHHFPVMGFSPRRAMACCCSRVRFRRIVRAVVTRYP